MEHYIEVFIPMRTPSMNKFKGGWKVYHYRYKMPWKNALAFFFTKKAKEKVPRNVVITTYHDKFYDKDNHIGGCKPIIDALRDLGWIWNDSIKWIEAKYFQKKVGEDGTREVGTKIAVW